MIYFSDFGVGGASSTSTLTIASGKVASDQSNFPTYVRLSDMPSGFWSAVASDGSNIRVRQSGSDLPIDLAHFNYAGNAGSLFFKANLLSGSNNVFTVEVVPGATKPADGDAIGRDAVWSAFRRVIHGGGSVDRTGSGSSITTGGSASFSGGVLSFGSNSYIYLDVGASSTSYSMFVYGNSGVLGLNNHSFISFSDSWSASPNRQTLSFRSSSEQLGMWNNTNSWLTDPSATADNTDFTAGCTTSSGGQRLLYRNGSNVASGTPGGAANIPSGATPVLILGIEDSSLSEDFSGDIELAILSFNIESADWFAAMDSQLQAPTSFYSIT